MRVIDSHVHVVDNGRPLPEMLAEMHAAFARCGFDGVCFAVNTCEGFNAIHRNLLAFLYKLTYPTGTYVYAGLDYHLPGTGHADFGFAAQAQRMAAIGADGYKMYEGKPNARKVCGSIPLTHALYGAFYQTLEQKDLPLALHLADPPEFWDLNAATEDQVGHGWFFGDLTHASWQQLYSEVTAVIAAHPGLNIIIPQMGYLPPDLKHMERLLSAYPNLYFDIAPAGSTYRDIAGRPAVWGEFIRAHAERLLFACTGVCADWSEAHKKPRAMRAALEGLGLGEETLSLLYHENFVRITPPRRVSESALRLYCAFVADKLDRFPCPDAFRPIRNRTLEVIKAIESFDGPKEEKSN